MSITTGTCGADEKTSRLALYLSALVWPGAGQFTQKRWLAGLFYAAVFSTCFVFLVIAIFAPMLRNLRTAMEFADTGRGSAFQPMSFVNIFSWLGISMLAYLAGLLDTYAAYRRACNRRRAADLETLHTGKI